LFRIDRNYVNLGATRFVQVDNGEGTEAGAVGESLNAAASVSILAQAQSQAKEQAREILLEAEEKAKAIADKIIEDARDEIAILMVNAREQAEEEGRKAWQEGYTEGSEKGKREFDEQLKEKIREDDEMLKRVINEIYDERERTYSVLEDEVIELALEIVRKVINPTEETIGGVFESLVRNALKQMAPVEKVILRVSPAEYERFFSSGSATFELDSGVTVSASILRDASLVKGDCIIDTTDETVNAGIESQLKYIKLAFDRAKLES